MLCQMLTIEAQRDTQQDRHGRGHLRRRQAMPGEGGQGGPAEPITIQMGMLTAAVSQPKRASSQFQSDESGFHRTHARGERNENQQRP